MRLSPTELELEAKLVKYRDLAQQYFEPVSVINMRLATDELEQQIRDLSPLPISTESPDVLSLDRTIKSLERENAWLKAQLDL